MIGQWWWYQPLFSQPPAGRPASPIASVHYLPYSLPCFLAQRQRLLSHSPSLFVCCDPRTAIAASIPSVEASLRLPFAITCRYAKIANPASSYRYNQPRPTRRPLTSFPGHLQTAADSRRPSHLAPAHNGVLQDSLTAGPDHIHGLCKALPRPR